MKVYVYLDESGSIHKNSKTKYFAVGGYFTVLEDKNKIISCYKKINKEIKNKRNIPLKKELKSYDLLDEEKVTIFNQVQEITSLKGFAQIFNKEIMQKEIVESNIFFNYAVKVLFKDCILPFFNPYQIIEFIVSVDNRNIRIGELDNLENYLQNEFNRENKSFKITYYDSATNFGIQLADLIVNTFYNYYKNKKIVKKVIPSIQMRHFRISQFPGHIISNKIIDKE